MTDLPELYRRAVEGFGERVHAVPEDAWSGPTPCDGWDVRTLVNHLVGENLWVPSMFEGKTIEEVGDRFDGDVLGDRPAAAWDAAAGPAIDAVRGEGAMDRTVHLSFGDVPGGEYTSQLLADFLIHGWDLARSIGADDRLDPELVEACAAWFAEREDIYRGAGVIADRPEVPPDADPQARLLAAFGRRA